MNTLLYAFADELVKIAAADPLEDFLQGAPGEAKQIRETGRFRGSRFPRIASTLDPGARKMRRDLREAKGELKFRESQARKDRLSDDPTVRQRGYAELKDVERKRGRVKGVSRELVSGGQKFKKKSPVLTGAGQKTLQRLKHRAVGGALLAGGAYGGYKYLQNKRRSQTLPPGY